MEKAYTTMKRGGVGSIVIGIVILTVGVAAGNIYIVSGAGLLKYKKEINV